jgi:enterochelin esterase family protein
MKGPVTLALLASLTLGEAVIAQVNLDRSQTVARTVDPGKTDSLPLVLNDGDFAWFSMTQHGTLNVILRNPDGTLLQRLDGTERQEKRRFSFAAEGGGVYKIAIENPGSKGVQYELAVEKIVSLTERLKPEPEVDSLISPRIDALRRALQSGNASTDGFWSEIRERGTPLVEPFGRDSAYRLVTFLWRGVHDTRNVLVVGSFADPVISTADRSMRRLGSSDVWYVTIRLPAGARFTYSLSPNDPMSWRASRVSERNSTRQMDPLNPQRLTCPPGASKFDCISVAELPNSTPQPWTVSKPGTPEGRVEADSIHSNIQNVDRRFWVYAPASYASGGKPNALLVLLDGKNYLSSSTSGQNQRTLTTLNELIAATRIPPTVAVFVDNEDQRLVDLIDNSKFADFLAIELVPWVRAHYNVTRDPAQTVIGGYSAGGFAAAYVGLRHSEVFGNVISQSGAFWWAPNHNGGICGPDCRDSGYVANPSMDATTEPNWMAQQFLLSQKLPLRFYLDAGTFEIDRRGRGGNILEPTRDLRDVLRAKGYEVHYQQVVSGHDGLSWRGTIADALIALLGGR